VLGITCGRSRAAQVDGRGLAQRDDRRRQHHVVRHHDRLLAARQRRVEQPERGHHALHLARQAARLEAHPVADLERARRDQDDARDQVAQRLLGGEADDDGEDRS